MATFGIIKVTVKNLDGSLDNMDLVEVNDFNSKSSENEIRFMHKGSEEKFKSALKCVESYKSMIKI